MNDGNARLVSYGELWLFRKGWRRATIICAVICGYVVFVVVGLLRGAVSPLAFDVNFFLIVASAATLRVPGSLAAATVSALLAGPLLPYFVKIQDFPPDQSWVSRFIFFELFGLFAGLVSELWRRQARNLQSTTDKLVRAEKMGTVGRLASGIAHDFNNILTVITGFAEVTASRLESPTAARESIEKILDAAQRGASLSHQILAYSRRQILSPSIVDLNQVIHDLKGILERVAGEQISVAVSLDGALCRTKIDYSQLEQVIMNLSVNARDAIEGPGTITFCTRNVNLTQRHREFRAEIAPGSYVLLTVADTGAGMSQETARRVFEPFFTTKLRGTGLGLSTVYGIVKQSKGYIYAESEIGKGTTFKIFLPVAVGSPGMRRSKPLLSSSGAARRGRERILFVEDDEEVRLLMKDALVLHGYVVRTAPDAQGALELFRRSDYKPELLITDIVLPDRDGFELSRQLTALRPGLKSIFVTGYGREHDPDPIECEVPPVILEKPFGVKELLATVKKVLEEETSTTES